MFSRWRRGKVSRRVSRGTVVARRDAKAAVLAAIAVVALAASAGCTAAAGDSASSGPSGAPSGVGASVPPPSAAALAGGACLLMNFATVRKELGTAFTVAAAADSSGSYSCVLQESSGSLPSLTLSITATDLSTADFKTNVVPSGSSPISELGKIAYRKIVPATKSTGPSIEVGWLSGNNRLIIFRYVCARDTPTATSSALGTKMVSLAQIVDQTTV
jgi:hypothetical protein